VDFVSMERICITIWTRLRGFRLRYIMDEITCNNCNSIVFSAGPIISGCLRASDLVLLLRDGIVCR